MKIRISHLIFVFIIFGFIVRAHTMQSIYFWPWDEGIYAEVADEILTNKTLDTTFNGHIWLNKPPFAHALVAAVFALFENRELAVRLLMVVFSSSLLIMTYQLTKKSIEFFHKKALEELSQIEQNIIPMIPVFLTASTFLFLERATLINTDVMLGVAWLGFFLTWPTYVWRLAFITFGTVTKSFLGLYPLGFEFLLLRKKSFSARGLLRGVGLVVIPLTWHIYAYITYGNYFINAHVLDQVVKRVTDPIELHYGGKLYYPELLVKNFSVFTVLIGLGYLVGLYMLYIHLSKKGIKKFFSSEAFFQFLILFAAVPFFTFLMFVQSKITWYMATLLPFLALPVAHIYIKIKNRTMRMLVLGAIIIFFLYRFIPESYTLNTKDYVPSDRIQLALCINKLPADTVKMLVDAEERSKRNTLEAAQQQTETSFIYGGSSSFVYYTDKNVEYYYRPEEFIRDMQDANLLVVSTQDRENTEYQSIQENVASLKRFDECSIGHWEVYTK